MTRVRATAALLSIASALAITFVPAVAAAEAIGRCRFDRETLVFAGSPVTQARCLLQKVEPGGRLTSQPLPHVLADRLEDGSVPDAAMLARAIANLPEPYRADATARVFEPTSTTAAGYPLRYFVIHDTSTPFLGNAPFPDDLDHDPHVNDLALYAADEPVAHVFLNRAGEIAAGHDFATPWRATKLESYVVGATARGRFVHIELVQPRRYAPGSTSRAETLAPSPGFSQAQYQALAALYVYASARAGNWLIPAFHATVDADIPDAHDDPQNFSLAAFAHALERLL